MPLGMLAGNNKSRTNCFRYHLFLEKDKLQCIALLDNQAIFPLRSLAIFIIIIPSTFLRVFSTYTRLLLTV